jgi:hypothetical protein
MASRDVSPLPSVYDESDAIQRMLDDGAPPLRDRQRQNQRSMRLSTEPPPEERAALRHAARLRLRVYCLACGRSADAPSEPGHVRRCRHCGGTLLVEPTSD